MKYVMILLLSGSVLFAHAETRGRDDPAYGLKQMIRQLSQERDALKTEKSKLEADNKQLKKDLDEKKRQVDVQNDKLDKSSSRDKLLTQRLEESYDRINSLQEKQRELEQSLRQTTASRDTNAADLNYCMGMNVKLFDAGMEVVKLYEVEASKKVDMVLQLKAVEIENTVQDYRTRLEDLVIPVKPVSTTATTPATLPAN